MANQIVTDLTSTINDRSVSDGANVSDAKLQHRPHATYLQNGPGNAVNCTAIVFQAYKPCTVYAAYVVPDVPPTGNSTFTVDVQKSTNAGAWATILSSNTALSNSSTARSPVALSLSGTPTLIATDLLRVVGTIAGTGNNVQGVTVTAFIAENGA